MNAPRISARQPDEKLQSVIKLAILAVGGQGGGVLTNWIESTARAQGYAVQATSVAGVAQRTGATIYYIEMAPATDPMPVFSLAPAEGDVDIMIAAEMMEAGRAIMRGFVTPDRTTLIASTHRALAVSEKMVPGDGIASSDEVREAAQLTSDQLIMFDMDRLATENGSVISSALFGALAASGALPFPREAFEDAIRASGKGVSASLCAFDAAFTRAKGNAAEEARAVQPSGPLQKSPAGSAAGIAAWEGLARHANPLPDPGMARLGLQKVIAYQDIAYGEEYLSRLQPFARMHPDNVELNSAAAKHIANAMCYDDIIRVADLKTRKARFDRIRTEMNSGVQPVQLTEFFHPRGEEVISLLPARLGRWIEARPALAGWIDRRVNKGRRVRTHRLSGFLVLYALGGLRRLRRISLRHAVEMAHLDSWLQNCLAVAQTDPAAAVELLKCQRLVKGYSDTHARGLSKFARVMAAADLVTGRDDAADWIARLTAAALSDEAGEALDGAVKTIESFAKSPPFAGSSQANEPPGSPRLAGTVQ